MVGVEQVQRVLDIIGGGRVDEDGTLAAQNGLQRRNPLIQPGGKSGEQVRLCDATDRLPLPALRPAPRGRSQTTLVPEHPTSV